MSDLAKQKGFTLYDYVNELFQVSIQAEEDGMSLQGIIEDRELLKRAKKAGFILSLQGLWYEMIELAYNSDKTEATRQWSEAGMWLAKRYASSGIADPIMAFKNDLEAFTWNSPKTSVVRTSKEISISMISPKFSESYTILQGAFLQGALKAFGYQIVQCEIGTGNIRIKAKAIEGA